MLKKSTIIKRTNNLWRYCLLIGIIALSALSCQKDDSKATFFVKGQFQDETGEPKRNINVHLKYEEKGGLGSKPTRERAGSGITDSMGNYKFECAVYGAGQYELDPTGYGISPLVGDTVDVGTIKW